MIGESLVRGWKTKTARCDTWQLAHPHQTRCCGSAQISVCCATRPPPAKQRPFVTYSMADITSITLNALGSSSMIGSVDWMALAGLTAGMLVAIVVLKIGRGVFAAFGCHTPSCCGALTSIATDKDLLLAPGAMRSDGRRNAPAPRAPAAGGVPRRPPAKSGSKNTPPSRGRY